MVSSGRTKKLQVVVTVFSGAFFERICEQGWLTVVILSIETESDSGRLTVYAVSLCSQAKQFFLKSCGEEEL